MAVKTQRLLLLGTVPALRPRRRYLVEVFFFFFCILHLARHNLLTLVNQLETKMTT